MYLDMILVFGNQAYIGIAMFRADMSGLIGS